MPKGKEITVHVPPGYRVVVEPDLLEEEVEPPDEEVDDEEEVEDLDD